MFWEGGNTVYVLLSMPVISVDPTVVIRSDSHRGDRLKITSLAKFRGGGIMQPPVLGSEKEASCPLVQN